MAKRYLIALGSNRRHVRFGAPANVIDAALRELNGGPLKLVAASPIIHCAPLGPSRRRYANAAAVVKTKLGPSELLTLLQSIEAAFGRRRSGQRWGARVLDLDVVLWSGGAWSSPGLTVPHTEFRNRDFVLRPALQIARHWRDPLTGLTLRHLFARLTRPRTMPR